MRGPQTTVILSRYTDVADGYGTNTRTWSDVRYIKGVLWTLSGNEMLAYSKLTDVVTHKLAFENLIGETITTRDRLRFGTRIMEIKYIDSNSDRGNWTILLLKEYDT